MKAIIQAAGIGVLGLLAVFSVSAQDAVNPAELDLSGTPQEICDAATPAIEPETRFYTQPEQVLEAGSDYRAVFCTDAGAIYIDLFEDYAPVTVNNFVFLAQNNYFNNTIFHRVMADFMAQGGDPTGTGTGGPGYQFADEPVGFLVFDRPGLLAMANAGPGTNGSQFFITTVPTPHLDFRHTIFGAVLEGQDNVSNILLRDPAVADAPATTLQSVVIFTQPDAVTTTHENTLEAPDSTYFVDNLSAIGAADSLPPELADGYEAPAAVETAARAAAVPEALQDDYATLLTDNGHAFGVDIAVGNPTCDEAFFFEYLGYGVDAFASAEAASNVLNSEVLVSVNTEAGYEAFESAQLGRPVYLMQVTSGCSEGATAARVYLQRGRYIVTINGTFSPAVVDRVGPEVLGQAMIETVPQLFEPLITDAYRAELP